MPVIVPAVLVATVYAMPVIGPAVMVATVCVMPVMVPAVLVKAVYIISAMFTLDLLMTVVHKPAIVPLVTVLAMRGTVPWPLLVRVCAKPVWVTLILEKILVIPEIAPKLWVMTVY